MSTREGLAVWSASEASSPTRPAALFRDTDRDRGDAPPADHVAVDGALGLAAIGGLRRRLLAVGCSCRQRSGAVGEEEGGRGRRHEACTQAQHG